VLRDIQDPGIVKKLFDSLGARYATRPGGYTRILRLGPRRGDGAEMAILELLGSEFKPKAKDEKGKKKEGEAAKPKAEAKAGKSEAKPKKEKGKAREKAAE
jgi:large subunit ribosomal protein L17